MAVKNTLYKTFINIIAYLMALCICIYVVVLMCTVFVFTIPYCAYRIIKDSAKQWEKQNKDNNV